MLAGKITRRASQVTRDTCDGDRTEPGLARITDADAVIGEHLRQTVHTGVRCSYWPG